MCWSATEEYNIGASHNHVSLRNPHKETKIQRFCNSEPFLKPRMSLKKKPQNEPQQTGCSVVESKMILIEMATALYRVFQIPNRREKKPVILQHLHKASKKIQMPKTDNSIQILSQKNKPELPLIKQWDGSEQISVKAVWEKITRPSVKVILDPNTANPVLKLSVDGRAVRTKTHKEFHSSKSFPEYQTNDKHHYNSWMCVQAQEGYTKGRHYWEVDVKGKRDWRIGVVKESAPRTGFINLNTAAGYWTLRLQLGYLMAMSVPVTKLNHSPPSKLGVNLDLEEGQVSFYDAIKQKAIYTFKAEFRKGEKIYPVFGTVETDKPLMII